MQPYQIKTYTFDQAMNYNVKVKPSKRLNYKIDVFSSSGKYLFSGGDINYSDYPTYIETHGNAYAEDRRRLYHIRHKYEPWTKGWFIGKLLW
jgi:hypothetical protein